MFISDLFTVAGYLHTAGFKNRWGINFAKCLFKDHILEALSEIVWVRIQLSGCKDMLIGAFYNIPNNNNLD